MSGAPPNWRTHSPSFVRASAASGCASSITFVGGRLSQRDRDLAILLFFWRSPQLARQALNPAVFAGASAASRRKPRPPRPLSSNWPQKPCVLSDFVNRGPDDCGANSSSASALGSAACCIHDKSCAVLPGSPCRRGPRGRPSCGNRGGPGRRPGPERWLLALWLPPQPRPEQQWQRPRIVN